MRCVVHSSGPDIIVVVQQVLCKTVQCPVSHPPPSSTIRWRMHNRKITKTGNSFNRCGRLPECSHPTSLLLLVGIPEINKSYCSTYYSPFTHTYIHSYLSNQTSFSILYHNIVISSSCDMLPYIHTYIPI